MTNEQKAKEMSLNHIQNRHNVYLDLVSIAEWKDEQYKSRIEQLEKELITYKKPYRLNWWERLQLFLFVKLKRIKKKIDKRIDL